MKIVYVTASLPFGPWEPFIIPEIRELIRRGHDITIVPFYPRGGVPHHDAAPFLLITKKERILSRRIILSALIEFLLHPVEVMRCLVGLFKDPRPRVLLKNLACFIKALWLAQFVRNSKIQHIHAHWMSTTATVAMIASNLTGVPWSLTAHRYDIVEHSLVSPKVKSALFLRFISSNGRTMLCSLRNYQRIVDHSHIIHMGIPIPRHSERKHVSSPEVPRIVCAAKLIPVKGHRYLIEACALLRDEGIQFELIIIGQGPLKEDICDQINRLQLSDQVHLRGLIPHIDLLKMYADKKVDIAVLPSIDLGNGLHEGIPVALIEAMGYEVPVVSTSTGGIPELLNDGAGILVPQKDPIALATAIKSLIHDPAYRQTVASIGYQKVINNFSIEKEVAKLEALFMGD